MSAAQFSWNCRYKKLFYFVPPVRLALSRHRDRRAPNHRFEARVLRVSSEAGGQYTTGKILVFFAGLYMFNPANFSNHFHISAASAAILLPKFGDSRANGPAAPARFFG